MMHEMASADTPGGQPNPAPILDEPKPSCQIGAGLDLLADGFSLREQQQVIWSARFGVGARHVEATKRMRPHHGSGAFPVQVEIAHVELIASTLQLLRRGAVNCAG